MPIIRFSKHLRSRCALNISVSRYGGNQFDVMIFGLCIYWRLPRWSRIELIHITAGLWKSQIFVDGKLRKAALKFRSVQKEQQPL